MATTEVEIVSPQRNLFSGEAEMVVCRAEGGDIAFLANHMPYLAVLEPGVVRLDLEGGDQVRFAVHGGFVEVHDNRVTMLASVAETPEEIDVARAERALEEAERRVSAGDDPDAEKARQRAEARLEVARGPGAGQH